MRSREIEPDPAETTRTWSRFWPSSARLHRTIHPISAIFAEHHKNGLVGTGREVLMNIMGLCRAVREHRPQGYTAGQITQYRREYDIVPPMLHPASKLVENILKPQRDGAR